MSKIPSAVSTLAATIGAGINIIVEPTGKAATVTVDPGMYDANLPEGLTVGQVAAVKQYDSMYFSAATKALGDKAIETFAAHKKVDEVNAEFPLHDKDVWTVGVDRVKKYAPIQPGGKETVTYGAINAKLVTQAARANRGGLQHIRDELSAAALAALAEK